ncbi:MAG: HNH endonuclease family protein [Aggregatilineales bacterium]
MLINPFADDMDYFKLMPTQVDRASFIEIVKDVRTPAPVSPSGNTLSDCYDFFLRKLTQLHYPLNDLFSVMLKRLSVVSIVLGKDDNAHIIFESLNAKGRPLTQADLIRNYFFMRIHVMDQEAIHARLWQPMEDKLKDNLTEFIRHFLMRTGIIIKEDSVYFVLKERYKEYDAIEALEEIATFADYYHRLIDPTQEPCPPIRAALARLKLLTLTTGYPFLLNCYDDYATGCLSEIQFVQILNILETFIIRRFVCGLPTSALNKIFPPLYRQAKEKNPDNLIVGLETQLTTGRQTPKDSEFRSRLISNSLYGAGQRILNTRLILETLEADYGHLEQANFDNLTIEHIMPQTLTDWWKDHLGKDYEEIYDERLHTLGNLTLTAYNSQASNRPYPEKRLIYLDSHLELNRDFGNIDTWNAAAIQRRSESLADRALTIWRYFGHDPETEESLNAQNVTGKTPIAVHIVGQRFEAHSWREVAIKTLDTLYDLDQKQFVEFVRNRHTLIYTDPGHAYIPHLLQSNHYLELNMSARQAYGLCEAAVTSMNLDVGDWRVECQ